MRRREKSKISKHAAYNLSAEQCQHLELRLPCAHATVIHTSPTAKCFPSGLQDTHVAALTRSRAVHDLPPGESVQSPAGEPKGETPIPDSRNEAAVRVRVSTALFVGVEGLYTEVAGFRGVAVGRAL